MTGASCAGKHPLQDRDALVIAASVLEQLELRADAISARARRNRVSQIFSRS